MSILPHKQWHVRRADNLRRVAADEAAEGAKAAEAAAKRAAVDSERRLAILKDRRRAASQADGAGVQQMGVSEAVPGSEGLGEGAGRILGGLVDGADVGGQAVSTSAAAAQRAKEVARKTEVNKSGRPTAEEGGWRFGGIDGGNAKPWYAREGLPSELAAAGGHSHVDEAAAGLTSSRRAAGEMDEEEERMARRALAKRRAEAKAAAAADPLLAMQRLTSSYRRDGGEFAVGLRVDEALDDAATTKGQPPSGAGSMRPREREGRKRHSSSRRRSRRRPKSSSSESSSGSTNGSTRAGHRSKRQRSRGSSRSKHGGRQKHKERRRRRNREADSKSSRSSISKTPTLEQLRQERLQREAGERRRAAEVMLNGT